LIATQHALPHNAIGPCVHYFNKSTYWSTIQSRSKCKSPRVWTPIGVAMRHEICKVSCAAARTVWSPRLGLPSPRSILAKFKFLEHFRMRKESASRHGPSLGKINYDAALELQMEQLCASVVAERVSEKSQA
jgi:hypothetical protein